MRISKLLVKVYTQVSKTLKLKNLTKGQENVDQLFGFQCLSCNKEDFGFNLNNK